MSGFCGLLALDGAPADPQRLEAMQAALAWRGGDGASTQIDGPLGLAHAFFCAGGDTVRAAPMAALGGLRLCGDLRLDGRQELLERLSPTQAADLVGAGDAHILLAAYRDWGQAFLDRVIGDFAFALWDPAARRLLLARDLFGVKPCFYARLGDTLLFSNTLEALRAVPGLPEDLDESAIADFLLFERPQDPAATPFAALRRLPGGHLLTAADGTLRITRHRDLPLTTTVRYRAAGDYVEHFRERLDQAVADRLPEGPLAIEMSGGLDSTAIAACAGRLHPRGGAAVHAACIGYERIFADPEPAFARRAADHLGLALCLFQGDAIGLYVGLRRPGQDGFRPPEPSADPHLGLSLAISAGMAATARVAFTGWDGDALLNEAARPWFRTLAREGRWLRLLAGLCGHALRSRRFWPGRPPAPGPADPFAGYPAWLAPDFERRLDLRDRWRAALAPPPPAHPLRPAGAAALAHIAGNVGFFDRYDAAWTGQRLDFRHPLLDLRLVADALALPPIPWCHRKHILRQAMAGRLPDALRFRPKTPLAGWPHLALLARPESRWIDHQIQAPGLDRFVAWAQVPAVCAETDPDRALLNLRPTGLNIWIHGQSAGCP